MSECEESKLVTKAEYARRKGWNRSYFSKPHMRARLAAAIHTDPQNGKEMIDPDHADRILADNTDKAKSRDNGGGPRDDPAPGSFDDIRRQLLWRWINFMKAV